MLVPSGTFDIVGPGFILAFVVPGIEIPGLDMVVPDGTGHSGCQCCQALLILLGQDLSWPLLMFPGLKFRVWIWLCLTALGIPESVPSGTFDIIGLGFILAFVDVPGTKIPGLDMVVPDGTGIPDVSAVRHF